MEYVAGGRTGGGREGQEARTQERLEHTPNELNAVEDGPAGESIE